MKKIIITKFQRLIANYNERKQSIPTFSNEIQTYIAQKGTNFKIIKKISIKILYK